jgi:hypothetical protein
VVAFQAVLGRFCSGRIPGAPPEEPLTLAWPCALGSLLEDDAAVFGAEAAVAELVLGPAGSCEGSGFSSIRTMYW